MQHAYRTVIVGGGTAGISVAARLRKAGETSVAIIDPAIEHAYQPLWTLVGGGRAPLAESLRSQANVIPKGVRWLQQRAEAIDPDRQSVTLDSGDEVTYDYLVVAPGIQLDWDRLPGASDALGHGGVSTNYEAKFAPKTWDFIRRMRSGTAVFTMPSGPFKCAGAPQKIAYLAADYWRSQGVLDAIEVVLVLPTPTLFGVPEFAKVLTEVVKRYGITVHLDTEATRVDPDASEITITPVGGGDETTLGYDLAHLVPPQSAPDWIKASPLTDPDDPNGYVEIDQFTLGHVRYPNVFSLGDAGSSPNSKTGAAVRKQAPTVVENLLATMKDKAPTASYDGYSSCPVTTARNRMLLTEFDYTMTPHPTLPIIDTQKERYDMWLFKRYGLPFMYWNLMLKGRA